MSETPTRRAARALLKKIAETPEVAISRRLASTPSLATAERLPVRTTKVVPSIELAESSLSSSSGSESGSDSEYNDEEWRRHLARRDPVRKPPTKGPALKPNKRPSEVESTRTAPAPKPAKTLLTSKPTVAVETSRATATVKAVKATATLPAPSSTTTAQTSETTVVQKAPHPTQPRKRPIKLKEDKDAWLALRKGIVQYNKKDQKEWDDHIRRQRYGTANVFRATEEQVRKAFGMCPRKHTRSSSQISEPVSTGQTHLLSNPEEPVMGQGSLCFSIERDQTPNLVDRLAEGLPQVIDLEDPIPEPPSPVKNEICEVPENQIADNSRVETVTKEVADLRCEVQYFKGQVSAYERTLEVDGVQIQHRLSFAAAVKEKKDPKDPEIHEESANEASVSVASKYKRPKLDKRRAAGRTAVARGEPGPSPQSEETEGRDPQCNDHGKSSVTDRDSRKRARAFTEPAPSTLGRDDHMDESIQERSRKRPRKAKPSKKDNEGQPSGQIIASPNSSDSAPGENNRAAPDQPRAFEREHDKIVQLRPGIGPQRPVAPQKSGTKRSVTNTMAQPIAISPVASRCVDPVVINNHRASTDAAQEQARLRAQQAPVASILSPDTNEAARSGPSVWKAGVNSIPLGPRQPRREPPHRRQTIQDRGNQRWQQSYDRREVFLPNALPRCVCRVLHSYFESGLNKRPNLAAFLGTREQFFANVEQIVSCRGHDKEMIIFCEGLWASEQANRKVSSCPALELKTRRQSTKLLQLAHRSYRFPTGNNVHLRFPDDGTIPPADKPSSSRTVTLPPGYRTPIKEEYMGRQRQVRRRRPSTILPHLFYGTAAPGANGPGKRKWPRR